MQPNLGTSLMLILGGAIGDVRRRGQPVVFRRRAGARWAGAVAVWTVLESRGTPWQFLHDYQYRRIDTFLTRRPTRWARATTSFRPRSRSGSGGWSGKGFMQGTQSRLNFLPEKHTDFIFTTLAEEFGFVGAFSLLALYALILGFCLVAAMQNRDRFSALLIIGVAANFFFYIAVNLSMVMGMARWWACPAAAVLWRLGDDGAAGGLR
jgi:rod shape determining protein RodA